MSYIGNTQQNQSYYPAVDFFSGNGSTTAFTLSRPVYSTPMVQVTIANVPQNPGSAFTINGNTITFTSAPPAGSNNIYVYYTSPNTSVATMPQSPVITGATTASGGFLSTGAFTGSYIDGVVTDYTSGIGRITVGASDAVAFYYGGPASRTETVRIDSSGNVGIGTNNPGCKLDIKGFSGATYSFLVGYGSTGDNYYTCGSSGIQVFRSDSTERMRISSSGNLLIGRTDDIGYRLSVLSSATPQLVTRQNSTGGLIDFNYGGSQVGSISTNGSNTTYGTSSDYRLKENIQPMQNALAVVQQLNPVTYTWKADGSDGQGFIAHELQAVVPDCVTGEKDAVDEEGKPVYQGIDTSFLVATLCKAIQEQQAQIETLTTKVAALEAK